MGPQSTTVATETVARPPATPVAAARDWATWYEELAPSDRRSLRNRALTASYEEVRDDTELRTYFLLFAEELADERGPGTARIGQLQAIVSALRGRADAEGAEQRRKAAAFLLAEFQAYLRDYPWVA